MLPTVGLLILGLILGCQAAPKTTVFANDLVAAESARCRPGRRGCYRAVVAPGVPVSGPAGPIPEAGVGSDGVSVSFGGYKASAGLGGTVNGGPAGGLHAEAGTPDGTGASAGLGGSVGSGGVAYSQAGGPGTGIQYTAGTNYIPRRPVVKRPNDFYDNIFNIPISVLESVNQLLGGSTPKHSIGGGVGASAGANAGSGTNFEAQARVGNSADSGSGSTTSTSSKTSTKFQAGTSGGADNPVGGFFDSIFNIPISALKSVNQFLNAKNEQRPAVPPSQTG